MSRARPFPGTTRPRGRQPNQMQPALINTGRWTWERWCNPGGGGGGLQPSSTPGGGGGGGGGEPWGTPGGGDQPPAAAAAAAGGGGEPWGTSGGGGEPPAAAGGGGQPSELQLFPRGGVENNGASSSSAIVHDLTVADENVLQCGVCFHPLKPPIFQCAVGHVLCSPCSDKLKNARNCHLCRVAMPGGYQRCHAMEDVVSSITRGPCPHAPYGCDATPAYYDREEHLLRCPHAPCHCPACGFVGPVAALVTHLTAAHGWPCTAEARPGAGFGVNLRVGFNFVTAVRGGDQYLFLLNMASTPFGHAVSAVWIRSPAAVAAAAVSRGTACELDLSFMNFRRVQEHLSGHHERSRFKVEGGCPSNGLPDPSTSFQFLVPKYGGGVAESDELPLNVLTFVSIVHSS